MENLVDANIVEIVKGKNGTPGEIRGSLGETGALGSISKKYWIWRIWRYFRYI